MLAPGGLPPPVGELLLHDASDNRSLTRHPKLRMCAGRSILDNIMLDTSNMDRKNERIAAVTIGSPRKCDKSTTVQ